MSHVISKLNTGGEDKDVVWNGKVFLISHERPLKVGERVVGMTKSIVQLNPQEMLTLIRFAGSLGEEIHG